MKIILLLLSMFITCQTSQCADNWFEETMDPFVFGEQLKRYCHSQVDYHTHMARFSLECQEKSREIQADILYEMYGLNFETRADFMDLILRDKFDNHMDWLRMSTKFLMEIQKIDKEVSFFSHAICFASYALETHRKKLEIHNQFLLGKKFDPKYQGSFSHIKYFYDVKNRKQYQDFIADYSRFIARGEKIVTCLDKIIGLFGKNGPKIPQVKAKHKRCKDDIYMIKENNNILVKFSHLPQPLSIENYFSFLAFLSPTSLQGYQLNDKMNFMAVQKEVPEDAQQKAKQLARKPVRKKKPIRRKEQKRPVDKASMSEETFISQESAMNKEEVKVSETISFSEVLAAAQPVQQGGGAQQPAQKTLKTTHQLQPTNREIQLQQRQVVIDQKLAIIAQQQAPIPVNIIPFADRFGPEELATLGGILTHQRNISWKDFEKLITSEKGFKGAIHKNKGGSYRSVVFNDPMTGKYVQFLVHKPHKPGQGSAVLYHDFMTRVKHQLEKNGVIEE